MTDFCKYVNVFHGCGEIDLPKPEGIAAKWFFIKAGCGNTTPAACVPFGAMSVSPYTGYYPTGYGDHLPNSCARPRKGRSKGLLGFAHLQQSGTGAIGYYYNYALVTPVSAGRPGRRRPISDETARPGYYSCVVDGIRCELTSAAKTALHRYTFPRSVGDGAGAWIDFTNNGLNMPGHKRQSVEKLRSRAINGLLLCDARIEGIDVFFAVRGNAMPQFDKKGAFFPAENGIVELKVSSSLVSAEHAASLLDGTGTFDEVRRAAYESWNNALSKIEIDAPEEIKGIFYSNLYHSMVKPCDRHGESFIYPGGDKAFVVDLATLWDMYKTDIPLLFMIDKHMGHELCETLLETAEALGRMPNSIGLTSAFLCENQARMLGDYVLMTAYRYGYDIDPHRMLRVIEKDVFEPGKSDFTEGGRCASHTFTLDMAEACRLAADIASEVGEKEIEERLRPLSELSRSCFDPETGLLRADSEYYEGTLYNYSFRQMADMRGRIELAGGDERFVGLLDRFFGFGAPDVVQASGPFDFRAVEKGLELGRFEGFNNESDMEAPYSYIYAGRPDRTCEIMRAGMRYMFTSGRGGLPGNNDTGALSSLYVLSAAGLFPVAGQDLFLLGSPFVNSAVFHLFNGAELKVSAPGLAEDAIVPDAVYWNGAELENRMIPASELLRGGELIFKFR